MSDVNDLVERYVAVWNEPDPQFRRKAIAALWTEDGAHYTPSMTAVGYDAIEERIAKAYEQWVRTSGFVFRYRHNADSHHDGVKFNWEMVPAAGGPVASVGFDFLVLAADGRIRLDYQFIES